MASALPYFGRSTAIGTSGSPTPRAACPRDSPSMPLTIPGPSGHPMGAASCSNPKVAKIALLGVFAGSFTEFNGTVQVIDNESSAIVYAYNVKKSNFQSAAEAFASHFKGEYLNKRK